MYMSKFSCWRSLWVYYQPCPRCIHWRLFEHVLLCFLHTNQMCHLGQSMLSPGPQRAVSVYMLCLSPVLPVPLAHLFQSQSKLHSAATFALCTTPPTEDPLFLTVCFSPTQSRHYFIPNFLALQTSLLSSPTTQWATVQSVVFSKITLAIISFK